MTAAPALAAFADEVGPRDRVTPAGSRTRWSVGGPPAPDSREVRAPEGVVAFLPEEMIVRVRAGTTVADLAAAVGTAGQRVILDGLDPTATVGGALAVGESSPDRLVDGPLRDAVLEVTFVDSRGALVRGGGPVVKNVSGFDLCRLLVGSLGTLGVIAEVVLRTVPAPAADRWVCGGADPFAVRADLHRPAAILWDGTTTWVHLRGHPADVDAQAAKAARLGCTTDAPGPPALPPQRWSCDPAALRDLRSDAAPFVAEVGVGVVHRHEPQPRRPVPDRLVGLHRSVKARFDPTGRLNPGREVLAR